MFRWLFSKTVREAGALHKHVYRMLCAQRDLLAPVATQSVTNALKELRAAVREGESAAKLRGKMWKLEETANKWLKPYPHPITRENIEVLLVAIAVAMGIRTFFLQPFKIPTGSMQPTLYGITSEPDFGFAQAEAQSFNANKEFLDSETKATAEKKIQTDLNQQLQREKALVIPAGWQRFVNWLHGISYVHVVAQNDGTLDAVNPPVKFLIFNIYQTLVIGGVTQTIWFPPDCGEETLAARGGLLPGQSFHKGDNVVKLAVRAGDHLFVDRLTYNFRKPERGEVVVFETKGIPEDARAQYRIPDDEFYIKRLCGLSGETITLNQDYSVKGVPQFGDQIIPVGNLVVDGKDITAATPHFENLYSFNNPPVGAKILTYQENHYYGHAMIQKLAPGEKYEIQPGHLFVMGDNTMNSLDSRFWGDFPQSSVIGKSFFVYWPLTQRFGCGN